MTGPASRPTSVSLHQRILERARLASAFPLARPSRWQTNFWSLNPHAATPYMPKRVLKGVDLSLAHLAWRKSTLLFLRAGVCTSCIPVALRLFGSVCLLPLSTAEALHVLHQLGWSKWSQNSHQGVVVAVDLSKIKVHPCIVVN